MNLTMYSDTDKNIVMFLPDGITDDEILALGSVSFPEDDDSIGSCSKPTGCIDLYNLHATYPLSDMIPTDPWSF